MFMPHQKGGHCENREDKFAQIEDCGAGGNVGQMISPHQKGGHCENREDKLQKSLS
jgi:hypothetical protein